MVIMKKMLLALAVCLTLCFTACAFNLKGNGIVPSKKVIEKNVPVTVHKNILVQGSISVVFTQGATPSVNIKGSDNLVPEVAIVENGETLTIRWRRNISINYNGLKRAPVVAYVTMPTVEGLRLDGSGDISVPDNLRVANLSVVLNGSGDIDLKAVLCNYAATPGSFSATLNGSGDIKILGELKADKVRLQLNGSGDLKATNTTASTLSTTLNGSGDLTVADATANASYVNLNGSGDLKIKNIITANAQTVLNGSGDLAVASIKADNVLASLKGSGDLTIAGFTSTANLQLDNSGSLDAKNLTAQDVTTSLIGSGDISCNAVQTLTSTIEGSGEVRYAGNPAVKSNSRRSPERL